MCVLYRDHYAHPIVVASGCLSSSNRSQYLVSLNHILSPFLIKHIEPIQTLHSLATPNLSIALCHGPEVLGGREPNDRQSTWRSLGIGAGTGQRRPQPRAGTAKSGDAWTLCFVIFVQNRIYVYTSQIIIQWFIIIYHHFSIEKYWTWYISRYIQYLPLFGDAGRRLRCFWRKAPPVTPVYRKCLHLNLTVTFWEGWLTKEKWPWPDPRTVCHQHLPTWISRPMVPRHYGWFDSLKSI